MDTVRDKTIRFLREVIAWVPALGILMVVVSLPFHYNWLQRWGLYFAGIGYLVDYAVNCRWHGWQWTRDKWVYVVFIAFYACIPVRQLFDPLETWSYLYKLREYLPFALIGIMGLGGMKSKLKLDYVTWAMLGSCVYMAVVLAVAMWKDPAKPFVNWLGSLNYWRCELINSHMTVNFYCNIALIFGTWTILHSDCKRWAKVLTGIGMAGCVAGLLLSEGRAGQLTMLVLMTVAPCVYLYKHHRKWLLPVLGVLLLFGGAVWYFNPQYHNDSAKDNPRLYIWRVAYETAKEKPVFGWGVSSARQQFIARGRADKDFCVHYIEGYESISKTRFGEVDYQVMHPHNVFLETMMEFGLVGLALLLLCIGLPIGLLPSKSKRLYLAACMFVFVMQAMFETFGRDLNTMWLPLMTLLWHFVAGGTSSDCATKATVPVAQECSLPSDAQTAR